MIAIYLVMRRMHQCSVSLQYFAGRREVISKKLVEFFPSPTSPEGKR